MKAGERANQHALQLPAPQSPVGFLHASIPGATGTPLPLQVWYPASGDDFTSSGFKHEGRTTRLNGYSGNRQRKETVFTNAREGAPLGSTLRYPVIFFGHDIGMQPLHYSVLLEHLAASGYVVLGVPMTDSVGFKIPTAKIDGSPGFSPFTSRLAWQWWWAQRSIQRMKNANQDSQQIYKEINRKWHLLSDVIVKWSDDFACAWNWLQCWQTGKQRCLSPLNVFSERLLLDKTFALGHGWGGAAAVQWGMQDSRVRAMINLNGFQLGTAGRYQLNKPLLQVMASGNEKLNETVYFPGPPESVVIREANHLSFTDIPLWSKADPTGVKEKALNTIIKQILLFINR